MQLHLSRDPRLAAPDGAVHALAPLDAALLAWLALEGPTPRARLAQLLWPDKDAEAARNSLRQRLFQLHRRLGRELVAGSATLALAPGVAHDLDEADTLLGDAGAEALAAGEFAQWLALQRGRRGARVKGALVELADMAEAARDWDDALAHARELLALDPLSEDAHRRLIRLHYLAGDRAAALLAFDACERTLKDEVGARPSAETLAVLALVERARPAETSALRQGPPQLARPPALVGRAAELEALQQCWHEGLPFLLLGEPGLGKSRLVEALGEAWPRARVVRARPGDADVPLAMLARLAALPHGETTAAAWGELARRLEPAAPGVARPQAEPLTGALHAALRASQSANEALLVDDWQFVDEASAALLAQALAAPDLEGMRIGYASRGGSERAAALRSAARLRVVELTPWSEGTLRELLAALDAPPQAIAALAHALNQRVGGNPMFVLETLRWMHRRGDPWLPQHVSVPARLRELVDQRLARLPDLERALLRIAALAGSDFGVELAEAVSARNAIELAEAWRALERESLLGATGVAHDVYAEQAREGLPEPIARLLHARIAAWLEKRPCAPARLAAHWRAAGDDARALPHLRSAAHEAWRAARADECLAFFAQAAAIEERAGRGDAACELWFEAADAATELGSAAQCAVCIEGMARHAATPPQQLRLRFVRAVARLGSAYHQAGLREIAALVSEAIALGDLRVEGECRMALANLAATDARFDEALQQLAAGERVLRLQGDERRALALAASMGMALGHRGQTDLALADLRRSVPLLVQHGDQATAVVTRASLVLQLARQGEGDAAASEAEQLLDAIERTSIAAGDTKLIHRALVDGLRWAGRFDLAWQADARLTERLRALGVLDAPGEPGAVLALHLGRADIAAPRLAALHSLAGVQGRRAQLRVALWQQQAALTQSLHAPWPDDAIACDDLGLAAEWALWSGLAPVLPWPVEAIEALLQRCRAGGVRLFETPLAALTAWRRGEAVEPAPLPADASAPWCALFGARACLARGQEAAARTLAQAGRRWVEERSQHGVPEAFSDAFVQRQPLHRELLALAARLEPR